MRQRTFSRPNCTVLRAVWTARRWKLLRFWQIGGGTAGQMDASAAVLGNFLYFTYSIGEFPEKRHLMCPM